MKELGKQKKGVRARNQQTISHINGVEQLHIQSETGSMR